MPLGIIDTSAEKKAWMTLMPKTISKTAMKRINYLFFVLCCCLSGKAQFYLDGIGYSDGATWSYYVSPGILSAGASYTAVNGALMIHGGNRLHVDGTYTVSANSTDQFLGDGTVSFTTTPPPAADTISGSLAPNFGIVQFQNGTGQFMRITNLQGFNVTTSLGFSNGITTTVRSNPSAGAIHFRANASYSNTALGDAQHVNGYVSKQGNTAFIFPVGDGTDLRTLTMSAPASAASEYAVAWIAGDPGSTPDPSDGGAFHPTSSVTAPVLCVSRAGQWDWIPMNGTGAGLTITVSMPDMSAFGAASSLRLAGWNGSSWVDLSGAATASGNTEGSTLSGTMIAGITAIGIASTPTISAAASNSVICSGATVTITPAGAASYTLNPSGATSTSVFTASPSATTIYTVSSITAVCAAPSTATVQVVVNTTPTVAIASVSNPTICSGNSTTIVPSGAATYTLLNDGSTGTSFSESPVTTTVYTITGISAQNCPSANSATTQITVNTTPTVAIASVSDPTICSGNTTTITPSGAATYTLVNDGSTGTSFAESPTATTIYTITGSSAQNCPSANSATTQITVNATPTVAIVSVSNPTICSGNSTTIIPSGAATYTLLNDGSTGTSFSESPTTTTIYTITGSSAQNCPSANSATTQITVNTTPTVAIASVSDPTICSGSTTTITPSGATTYTLLNDGSTGTSFAESPAATTIYTITGSSAQNCPSANSATAQITVNMTPTVAIASVSSPLFGQYHHHYALRRSDLYTG